jgi:hypothetical protein
VELQPLVDPASIRPGSDLPLRVHVPGGSSAGTKVIARHAGTNAEASFIADAGGTGAFRVAAPGVWTVEAHRARRVSEPDVDWEIHSATLTFAVPEPGAQREGGGR